MKSLISYFRLPAVGTGFTSKEDW